MSHLNDIKMSYLGHLIGALGYSFESLKASIIFVFHGFFPDYCVYTGSTIISNLNDKLKKHSQIKS